MINFILIHPKATQETLGFIPGFLSDRNPAPAAEQLHAAYPHGGGWHPMTGWTREAKPGKEMDDFTIKYPGDSAMRPIAYAKLREEIICFYDCAFVGIFQPNGTFEISRMD
jgi:hypothetical protein